MIEFLRVTRGMENMNRMTTRMGRVMAWCGALGAALWLAGCAVTDVGRAPQMSPGDVVAVLPIVNNTETPQAGLRAEAIAESLKVYRSALEDGVDHYLVGRPVKPVFRKFS